MSFFKGGGRREEKVVLGWRAWARPHGRVAVRPCVFLYPLPHGIFCRTQPFGIFAVLNGSTVLFLREKGEEGRGECVAGALGRARTAILPRVQ